MNFRCHIQEGIALQPEPERAPATGSRRPSGKAEIPFNYGRRRGEESGGFLQEGLKDGEGWTEGKDRWGKLCGFLSWESCLSISAPAPAPVLS